MKKFIILFIFSLTTFFKSEELNNSSDQNLIKNWVNTCNIDKCLVAINQCAGCNKISVCKSCIINYDPICSICANDIFDTNYMILVNGLNYLFCDQYDYFQTKVCQIYCTANDKTYGECKTVQSSQACLCYSNFNGNLYKTLTGSSSISSLASSSIYGETVVGYYNGTVNFFSNNGDFKRTFQARLGVVKAMSYLSNGDILVTGGFGTRLFSYSGIQKIEYSSRGGNANTILKNGDIVYSSSSTIYISTTSSTEIKL